MTAIQITSSSPFDEIRHVREDGSEFWSARDLMPLLGYPAWREFTPAIDRAQFAAKNQGLITDEHFGVATKVTASGPSAADCHLSRFAAYLVAMNGDPRKPEVAAAQSYFAIRTREAEVARPRDLSRLELIDLAREAETERLAAEDARLAAEERSLVLSGRVAELEPKAKTFDLFLGASGDMSVNEAAKVLSRDQGISTGQQRLFTLMERERWVYRDHKGRPIPYQSQIDNGRLVAKARWYTDDESGEQVATTPQVRVTPKGLDALRTKLIAGAA